MLLFMFCFIILCTSTYFSSTSSKLKKKRERWEYTINVSIFPIVLNMQWVISKWNSWFYFWEISLMTPFSNLLFLELWFTSCNFWTEFILQNYFYYFSSFFYFWSASQEIVLLLSFTLSIYFISTNTCMISKVSFFLIY